MSEESAFRLSFPEQDIGLLTVDDPVRTVNLLSRSVRHELAEHLTSLEGRDLAGLILISGKPTCFLAGADLAEVAAERDWSREQKIESIRSTQRLFQRFSTFSGVTVAAIRGVCLGGGAELALWCDRRIVADDAQTEIGFPEVQLGLHPGWGGTARAPRIVGLPHAVELITQGQRVGAVQAVAMGLADELATPDQLLPAAIARIRRERSSGQYLIERKRRCGPVEMPAVEREFLLRTTEANLRTPSGGRNPAALAALELLGSTTQLDLESACRREAEGVARLLGSPAHAALSNVHAIKRRNKKEVGARSLKRQTQPVQAVAVIGAGIMGSGIAAVSLQQQIPVTLYDADPDALSRGVEQTLKEVCRDPATKQPSVDRTARFAPLLRGSRSEADLANCDVVIEAIVETPEVKKQVYRRIEPRLSPHAILGSNTSTIRISELAKALQQPERLCGMHFFNPVRMMQLVEVIRGEQTSDETVAKAVAFARQLGKFAIVVQDRPGFLVNRLLGRYLNEALELLAEGASLATIEQAATDFGMPVGPLHLYDIIGLDTAFYAGKIMWEAFPDRIKPSPILPALVKRGRLGCKSGAGFFAYPQSSRKPQEDPLVEPIIRTYLTPRPDASTDPPIADRLILPMLLEATRVLQEEVVLDPRDVDLGLICGIGFPAVKGGLLYWADSLGIDRVMELLQSLEHLGPRFAPTPLLQQMAETGATFYSHTV